MRHAALLDQLGETLAALFPPVSAGSEFDGSLRRMRIMNALAFCLRAFLSTVLLCAFALAAGLASDRAPPVIVLSSAIGASAPVGGDLVQTTRVYRTKVCHTTLERGIIDAAGVRFDAPDLDWSAIGDTGEDVISQLVPIDPRAVPGRASLEVVLTYRCNPLHFVWPIVVRRAPRPFEITRGPVNGQP